MSRFLAALGVLLAASSVAHAQDDVRFRWGIGGGGGYFVPAKAVDFGGQLRLGAQISEKFGAYGQISGLAGFGIGGSASSNGGSVSVSGVSMYNLAAMAEYDLGGPFIAGGPLLARGGWGQVVQGADADGNVTQEAIAAGGGILPGLDLTIGFIAGKAGEDGRRKGFRMALDTTMVLAKVTSGVQQAGQDGASQRFETGKSVIGVTPMLTFGFEAR